MMELAAEITFDWKWECSHRKRLSEGTPTERENGRKEVTFLPIECTTAILKIKACSSAERGEMRVWKVGRRKGARDEKHDARSRDRKRKIVDVVSLARGLIMAGPNAETHLESASQL